MFHVYNLLLLLTLVCFKMTSNQPLVRVSGCVCVYVGAYVCACALMRMSTCISTCMSTCSVFYNEDNVKLSRNTV